MRLCRLGGAGVLHYRANNRLDCRLVEGVFDEVRAACDGHPVVPHVVDCLVHEDVVEVVLCVHQMHCSVSHDQSYFGDAR